MELNKDNRNMDTIKETLDIDELAGVAGGSQGGVANVASNARFLSNAALNSNAGLASNAGFISNAGVAANADLAKKGGVASNGRLSSLKTDGSLSRF